MITNPGSVAGQMPPGDDALIRRIQDLERTVRELGPAIQMAVGATVATLATTVATLGTTVTNLTAAQATLTSLVSAQVSPDSFYQSASGTSVPVGGTYYDVVSRTITVPSGFTKVVVTATPTVTLNASPAGLGVRAVVNGTAGPDILSLTSSGLSAFSQLITGLTGGGTFIVKTQAAAIGSGSYSTTAAIIMGTLIWFR